MEKISQKPTRFDASPTTQTNSPVLPSELLCSVVDKLRGQSLAELAFLWSTVRNVSISFKAEVEKLFAQEYLVKSTLLGYCGYFDGTQDTYHFNRKGFLDLPFDKTSTSNAGATSTKRLGTSPFNFSHFDQIQSGMAVYSFSEEEQEGLREIWHFMGYKPEDEIMIRAKRLPTRSAMSPFAPDDGQIDREDIFVAQIRGAKDHPMDLDTEGLQISANWMEMLTKFFGAQDDYEMKSQDDQYDPWKHRHIPLRRNMNASEFLQAKRDEELFQAKHNEEVWKAI